MKRLIIALSLICATRCLAVDVVLGTSADLTWTGAGTTWVATFGGGVTPNPFPWDANWYDSVLISRFLTDANPTVDESVLGTTTAAVINATYAPASNGVSGAWQLSGTDSYLDWGDTTALDGATQATLSAWVRLDTAKPHVAMIRKYELNQRAYILEGSGINGAQVDIGVSADGTNEWYRRSDAQVLSVGVWHYFCGTWNGGTNLTLTRNNLTVSPTTLTNSGAATVPVAIPDTSTHLMSGRATHGSGETNDFVGAVDSLRMYSTALSFGERQELFWQDATNHDWFAWHYDNRAAYSNCEYASQFNRSTLAEDVSWAANKHGVLGTGAAAPARYNDGANYAWTFDGTDYITAPSSIDDAVTNQITLAAWIYPTATNSNRTIIRNDAGLATSGFFLRIDDGVLHSFYRISAGNRFVTGTIPVPVNAWTHAAATYDGTTMRLYVNGQPDNTGAQTGNITLSTQPMLIGSTDTSGTAGFVGRIDDVQVYDACLTPTDISGLYQSTTGVHP